MIKNYFKITLRNLWRNKGFSAINIIGLAVGMAAAMLILLWIQNERSFDGFHKNKNRIYQVWNQVTVDGKISCWNSVSAPVGPIVQKDLPEVERSVRIDYNSRLLFSVGDKKITTNSGLAVDTGFLQMFTFPMLEGNPSTALNDMHSI